jgi:bifunctional non-homologous end joining protein LigD
MMALETYRQKRNFERTAEPRGRKGKTNGRSFVVQKHAARSLHYDFRLELDGVLLSWAVPKGPSLDPKVKRLAMQTEDHPIEYGGFEGVIPEGEYGGGTVLVWDRGTWEPEGDAKAMYERGRLNFVLHGSKLHGAFHLVRTGRGKERRWLLMKSADDAARPGSDDELLQSQPNSVTTGRDLERVAKDPDHVWTSAPRSSNKKSAGRAAAPKLSIAGTAGVKRTALPDFVEPALATLTADAPAGEGWLHEIKLDGYRILARVDDKAVRLASRRGHDWTSRLPSIASALGALSLKGAWLDGEVVVLGQSGVSDFQRLQNSMEAGKDAEVAYFVFDAPFLDGYDLRKLTLLERKELLGVALGKSQSGRVRYGDHVQGNGAAFFAQACRHKLEGIVSKRADSPYVSGRGRAWLKVKCLSRQEFVIGGFTEPEGSREHLGALLLGLREQGQLSYVGKVGTGFTRASLAELVRALGPLEQKAPPFVNPPLGAEARGVHWLSPKLVAEVSFAERTSDGMIRHASFHGLREDKAPEEVRAESAEPAAEEPDRARNAAAREATKTPAAKPVKKAAARAAARPAKKTAGRKSKRPSAKAKRAEPHAASELDLSRLEVTHPDRVLYPDQGLTKRDLMLYYARVSRWMLPHVIERPLMLVRCPEGAAGQCFHQKHPSRGMPKAVAQVEVQQKTGPEQNLLIRDVAGLLGLVQMGALEIHTWGSRADAVDYPDQLVFDLDPDAGLPWERVVEAAHEVRRKLEGHGLVSFVKTTGGKGLHVVTPVTPTVDWDRAKRFSKALVEQMVAAEPSKYLAVMTKQKRTNKIFLDYLRNGYGATAVCAFSTRARAGAPVSVPITWDELDGDVRSGSFDVQNLDERLNSLRKDPWADFEDSRAEIPVD